MAFKTTQAFVEWQSAVVDTSDACIYLVYYTSRVVNVREGNQVCGQSRCVGTLVGGTAQEDKGVSLAETSAQV